MVALAIRTQLRGHSQSQYGKFGQKLAPAKGEGKEKAKKGKRPREEEEEEEEEGEEEEEQDGEAENEGEPGAAGFVAPGSPLRRR